jgi:hypothetical protein
MQAAISASAPRSLSVTKGEDKPLNYPPMFRVVNLMILNKIDLLLHVDFDPGRCLAYARRMNPAIECLQLSATTGQGMEAAARPAPAAGRARGATAFQAASGPRRSTASPVPALRPTGNRTTLACASRRRRGRNSSRRISTREREGFEMVRTGSEFTPA